MDEHPEAPALQPVDHPAQQQQVLEHASGEGHGGEALGIAETDAGFHHGGGEAIVEAGRDGGHRDPGGHVLGRRPHQVMAGEA